jgi:phosphate starvation-inducible PhoH-like protein
MKPRNNQRRQKAPVHVENGVDLRPGKTTRAQARALRQDAKCAEFQASNYLKPPEGKTPNQKKLLATLGSSTGTIVLGPAGTGKTFLAVAWAIYKVAVGKADRAVFTRPTVSAGENLGYLPGDQGEKLEPWLIPIYDSIDKQIGRARREKWTMEGRIEICSFQHMQGRTWENAVIVLDEGQNTTPFQMETFLTRLGVGSQYVVVGDPHAQRAIAGPSGMVRVLKLIQDRNLPVPVCKFTFADVQRDGHARMWAEAFYDDHEHLDGMSGYDDCEEAPDSGLRRTLGLAAAE